MVRKGVRAVTAAVAGLLLLGAVGSGLAQQMKGMEGMAQKAQAPAAVEDQLRQLQEELKALRKELAELRGSRGGQMPMGPGQMPMGPGMMGGQMGMMPQMMQPMMQMMQAGAQMMQGMMAQTGAGGGMAPQQK